MLFKYMKKYIIKYTYNFDYMIYIIKYMFFKIIWLENIRYACPKRKVTG